MLVLILAIAAVIMVLLKSEAAVDLGALLMPFLAVALPYMTMIAALAVVFDTVPWLRGAVGNAVYFFIWMFLFMSALKGELVLPLLKDPLGFDVFRASLYAGANAAFPNEEVGSMSIAGFTKNQFKLFNWPGLNWTLGIVAGRWLWAVFGLGLILLSALWFARFDPSREGLRRARGKSRGSERQPAGCAAEKALRRMLPNLSPLVSKLAQVNPFLGVLFAELRLLLNGRRWWWWLGIAGLNIAILVMPASDDKIVPVTRRLAVAAADLVGDGQPRAKKQHLSDGLLFCAPGAAPATGCLAGGRSGDGAVWHLRGSCFHLKW